MNSFLWGKIFSGQACLPQNCAHLVLRLSCSTARLCFQGFGKRTSDTEMNLSVIDHLARKVIMSNAKLQMDCRQTCSHKEFTKELLSEMYPKFPSPQYPSFSTAGYRRKHLNLLLRDHSEVEISEPPHWLAFGAIILTYMVVGTGEWQSLRPHNSVSAEGWPIQFPIAGNTINTSQLYISAIAVHQSLKCPSVARKQWLYLPSQDYSDLLWGTLCSLQKCLYINIDAHSISKHNMICRCSTATGWSPHALVLTCVSACAVSIPWGTARGAISNEFCPTLRRGLCNIAVLLSAQSDFVSFALWITLLCVQGGSKSRELAFKVR